LVGTYRLALGPSPSRRWLDPWNNDGDHTKINVSLFRQKRIFYYKSFI
jgi:hypothetical protein